MSGRPPPLGLPPRSPEKPSPSKRKWNGSAERESLAPLRLGAPPSLSFGIKRANTPRSNSSGRNTGRASKRAKESQCGDLEPGEFCESRSRAVGESYGSEIYFIRKVGNVAPIKVRKLVTPGLLFSQIGREAAIYETLSKKDGFTDFCLPFLKYTDGRTKRYIDFEYVEGVSLDKYVHGKSERERIGIFKQCVRCLKVLAGHGYVHGDIKMDNFWWDSDRKRVLIFDFEYVTRNPSVIGRESDRSISYEVSKFFDLIELKEEFNLKAHMEEILKGEKEVVKKNILSTEDSAEGMQRLLALYRQILGEGGGAALPRGGARRTTRRKNRRSK